MTLFPKMVSISKDGRGKSCRNKQKNRAFLASHVSHKGWLGREFELKWGEEKAQKQ